MKKAIILMLLLTGCGFSLHHTGIPDNVTVTGDIGPDFEKAAAFCDTRYGAKTAAAEACFLDYRDYTKVKVSLDLTAIEDFCSQSYSDQESSVQCVTDLTNLLNKLVK